MMPVMARNLLESIRLLAGVSRLFADRCVAGITADEECCRQRRAPGDRDPLNPYLGYEEAASIAKQALAEGRTIRDVVLARGHVAQRATHRGRSLTRHSTLLRMTRP